MRYLALFLLLAGACAKKRYDGHRLVKIQAKNMEEAAFLQSLENDHGFEGLDFWTLPSTVIPTDIRVSPNDFGKLRKVLRAAGMDFEVTKENIQIDLDLEEEALTRGRARASNQNGLCNFYEHYCTYEQVLDRLTDWSSTYAINAHYTSIGTTHEGRGIPMIQIVKDHSGNRPAVIVEAGTHAREWITVSSALVLIEKLLEGPERADLLEHYDWFILPVHNPDGYVYSFESDRLWRKNRGLCSGWPYGIDLNRNWDANFGGPGSSPWCSSSTYRGQWAFEAEETEALKNAFLNIQGSQEVRAFFSVHSYSQLMLLPYAYTTTQPDNYDHLLEVAQVMMDALYEVDNQIFRVGSAAATLYPASGGAFDYFYDQGVYYSYTYELRPATQDPGFVLPENQIVNGTEEFYRSIVAFVDKTT